MTTRQKGYAIRDGLTADGELIAFPVCLECRCDRAPLDYPEPTYRYEPIVLTHARRDETCSLCDEVTWTAEPTANRERGGNDWESALEPAARIAPVRDWVCPACGHADPTSDCACGPYAVAAAERRMGR